MKRMKEGDSMSENIYTPNDVFCPTAFPQHTYIERKLANNITYTQQLQYALQIKGKLIIVSGHSKSGKTVLCRNVISRDKMVLLTGVQIKTDVDFWQQIAEQISMPYERQYVENSNKGISISVSDDAEGKIPLVASGKVGGQVSTEIKSNTGVQSKILRSNRDIVNYLINNDFVLVLDDFHYLSDELQLYIARVLKAEMFDGLKAIITTLPHRSDDAIRKNPDLVGRTAFIQLSPWTVEDLSEIAKRGFGLLKYDISEGLINKIAIESLASPQLMQENCLNLARNTVGTAVRDIALKQAFHLTTMSSNCSLACQQVRNKSYQSGSKRKLYTKRDGDKIDIYSLLLEAISIDPPVLFMNLDEIKNRISRIIADTERPPNQLNIVKALKHIATILKEANADMETLEWREQKLYVIDPFLLFYLRWGQ